MGKCTSQALRVQEMWGASKVGGIAGGSGGSTRMVDPGVRSLMVSPGSVEAGVSKQCGTGV
jgi:hypothetical protein